MGAMKSMEMAEAVNDGSININDALRYHLTSNHYPPVPTTMIEPCRKAIILANDGMGDELVDLPQGIRYKGDPKAPAIEIIEAHHLEYFLDQDEF